jgi:hypothetical protein
MLPTLRDGALVVVDKTTYIHLDGGLLGPQAQDAEPFYPFGVPDVAMSPSSIPRPHVAKTM